MGTSDLSLDLDFEQTLAALLEMLGNSVSVTLTDAGTLMIGGVFGGTLQRGQDIWGDAVAADSIVFDVDGGYPATFTISSRDFHGACWDDGRGLYIRAGAVQFWITPENH